MVAVGGRGVVDVAVRHRPVAVDVRLEHRVEQVRGGVGRARRDRDPRDVRPGQRIDHAHPGQRDVAGVGDLDLVGDHVTRLVRRAVGTRAVDIDHDLVDRQPGIVDHRRGCAGRGRAGLVAGSGCGVVDVAVGTDVAGRAVAPGVEIGLGDRVGFEQRRARCAGGERADVVDVAGQRVGHDDVGQGDVAGVGRDDGVVGDVAGGIAERIAVTAGEAVEYLGDRQSRRGDDRRGRAVAGHDGVRGALLGRGHRGGVVLVGVAGASVGVEVGLVRGLGRGVTPGFPDIEHAEVGGVADVEPVPRDHRDRSGIGQRIGDHDVGQRGLAVVEHRNGIVGDIARAVDRGGAVQRVGAVSDVDEHLVDRDMRGRSVVADRRGDRGYAFGHGDRLERSGGAGGARGNDLADVISADCDAVERIGAVGGGRGGADDEIGFACLLDSVVVDIARDQLDRNAADRAFVGVLDRVTVDIVEFRAGDLARGLEVELLEPAIGNEGPRRGAELCREIEIVGGEIRSGKVRDRNENRIIVGAAARVAIEQVDGVVATRVEIVAQRKGAQFGERIDDAAARTGVEAAGVNLQRVEIDVLTVAVGLVQVEANFEVFDPVNHRDRDRTEFDRRGVGILDLVFGGWVAVCVEALLGGAGLDRQEGVVPAGARIARCGDLEDRPADDRGGCCTGIGAHGEYGHGISPSQPRQIGPARFPHGKSTALSFQNRRCVCVLRARPSMPSRGQPLFMRQLSSMLANESTQSRASRRSGMVDRGRRTGSTTP